MSIKLKLLLEADAKAAKAEIAGLEKTVKGTTSATDRLGKTGKTSAAGVAVLGGSAQTTAAQVDNLAAKERAAAASAALVGRNHKMAAGQVGNLTAQFNDIGVMLQAGQSPLTLALQQGTQITQVIGPMGAAGAVKALGSAFMQMINPVSLITIGSIAAGAAMFQWLTASGDKARSFSEELSDLEAGIARYSKAVEAAADPSNILGQKFGMASVKAQALLKDLEQIERKTRSSEIGASVAAMMDAANIDLGRYRLDDRNQLSGLFDVNTITGTGFRENKRMIRSVLRDFDALKDSASATTDVQIAATEKLISSFEAAANKAHGVTVEEDAQLTSLKSILLAMYELQAIEGSGAQADIAKVKAKKDLLATMAREETLAATIARFGENSAQAHNLRLQNEREIYQQKFATINLSKREFMGFMDGFDAKNQPRDPMAERIASANKYAGITKAISATQAKTATEILDDLLQENVLREAIIEHGEHSAIVEEIRRTQARSVLEVMLEQLDVAGSMKNEIRRAWEHAQTLNGTEMDAGIVAAAAAAKQVADEITRAVSAAQSLAAQGIHGLEDAEIRLKYVDDPVERARALGKTRMMRKQSVLRDTAGRGKMSFLDDQVTQYGDVMAKIAQKDKQRVALLKKNRGGGGAKSTQKQVDALARLIEKEQLQLALLRETDPLQKEMLRNRKALAGATDIERASVEAIIAERIREADALQNVTEKQDLFKTTAYSALEGLTLQGNTLADVMDNVGNMIEKAALQAILLGEGPLANLLGGSGGGGLLGFLAESIFPGKTKAIPAKAEGGKIYGAGSGTSDDVLLWGSNGEFMINQAATRRHLPLLEAINSGMDIPGFAAGGHLAPARSGSSQQGGAGYGGTLVQIINQSSTQVTGEIEETVAPNGQRKAKIVLADMFGKALTTPGSGAKKAMKQSYGLQPAGVLR